MSKIFKLTIGEIAFTADGRLHNVIAIRDAEFEEEYVLDNNTVVPSSELYTYEEYRLHQTELLNNELTKSIRFLEKYGDI